MVSVSIAIRQYSGRAPKMDLFDQGRADYRASRQLVQQRLGLLQHRRVEAFGEPVVDRREKVTSFGALALITPEAGEAGGSTKLKSFRILSVRYGKTLLIILLGCGFSIAVSKPPRRRYNSASSRRCLPSRMICSASARLFKPSMGRSSLACTWGSANSAQGIELVDPASRIIERPRDESEALMYSPNRSQPSPAVNRRISRVV